MVNYQKPLDRIFAALADPTRRALIARLEGAQDGVSVSELARPFPVSLPAIMKHLDVLSDAGLVIRRKSGRTVHCQLRAQAMKSAMDWLHRYERFWSERLNTLAAILEEDESCPPQQPSSQALPSSAASTRRPARSSPRSSSRKPWHAGSARKA